MTGSHDETSHRLGPPDADRPVLRSNVYEVLRGANTTLIPLFPYLGPGAIVPAGAMMLGHEAGGYGRFFHRNSQEEIVVSWGSNDHMLQAGILVVGGKMHEVKAQISDPTDPSAFAVAVITQRQAADGQQTEAVIFRCAGCNERLFSHQYDASTGGHDEPYLPWASMEGGVEAADGFNEKWQGQPCPKCGAVQERFPVERWGWRDWAQRHPMVNAARRQLDGLALELGGEAAAP